MLYYLFTGVLAGLAVKLLNNYRQLSMQLLRIEATKCYLRAVQMARLSAIGLLGMGLCIALMSLGVLLLHAGVFILLPWSVETKAVLGMCLGVVYLVGGGVGLHAAMTERNWMKMSGATDMLNRAIGQSQEDRHTG